MEAKKGKKSAKELKSKTFYTITQEKQTNITSSKMILKHKKMNKSIGMTE
jgi:hypothetical protein